MSTLPEYLSTVCGISQDDLPESGAIQVTLTDRCNLNAPPVIITPEDQFEAATITMRSSYVDVRSQASAMAKYRRISGQEGMITLSLQNPFDERFAALFLQGNRVQATPSPTPAPAPAPSPSPSSGLNLSVPWDGRSRTELLSNAGKLPTPYLARIQFAIGGTGGFAPLELYAPLAFPTFDEIALQRAVDSQSGANVMLECKAEPDGARRYMVVVYG